MGRDRAPVRRGRSRRRRRRGDLDAGDAEAGPARSPTQVFHPLLHVANLVLSDQRFAATVTIDALDVGGSRAPAELARSPSTIPSSSRATTSVLDYALDELPDVDVTALFLASSVDVSLADDAAKHAAFATFVTECRRARPRASSRR